MNTALVRALPILLVSVGLLVWGALESNQRGFGFLATSLVAAGLVILGVWISLEVMSQGRDRPDPQDEREQHGSEG